VWDDVGLGEGGKGGVGDVVGEGVRDEVELKVGVSVGVGGGKAVTVGYGDGLWADIGLE